MKRVDRRTLLKGGLAAGRLLGAGLAIRAAASDDRLAPPQSTSPLHPSRATHKHGGRAALNIFVILVDHGASAAIGPSPCGLARACPQPPAISARGGLVLEAPHRLQRLQPLARGPLDCSTRGHPQQTGCMSRRQHLDPGFPAWGTMLREQATTPLGTASGISPTATSVDAPAGRTRAERYGVAGARFPSP